MSGAVIVRPATKRLLDRNASMYAMATTRTACLLKPEVRGVGGQVVASFRGLGMPEFGVRLASLSG
jgi:hypothetical protein